MKIELHIGISLRRAVAGGGGTHEAYCEAVFPSANLWETARIIEYAYTDHLTGRGGFQCTLEKPGLRQFVRGNGALPDQFQAKRDRTVQ
jgi:hypothetical protein